MTPKADNNPITTCEDVPGILKNVVFHPEYTFTVSSIRKEALVLAVGYKLRETDDAPNYEQYRGETYDRYYDVNLSEIPDTDHLLRLLIKHAKTTFDDAWEHDAREYMRLAVTTYAAPFHPHHYGDEAHNGYNDGGARWRAAENSPADAF